MASLKIDTAGMTNVITNIRTDNEKYQMAIDNFFNEIEKVSDYWKGPDADKFIFDAALEKKSFDNLKLILDDCVDVLEQLKINNDNYNSFQG